MMPDQLPSCLCGSKAWQSGGSQMGNGSFHFFSCVNCGRLAVHVYYYIGILLMTERWPTASLNQVELDYVNGPLMTALRFREMRLKEAQTAIENKYWDGACDQLQLPRGTTMDGVPKDLESKFRELSDYTKDPQWVTPPGFGEPLIPPQVPVSLMAAVLKRNRTRRWRSVTARETQFMPVPLDPIRIHHDKYWKEVFVAIEPIINSGEGFEPQAITNHYSGSLHEPWYEFWVNEAKFTVGPRHNVDSIGVDFSRPVSLRLRLPILEVSQRDNVTYEGKDRRILIHAWNKYRLIEYLTILINLAKGVA